MAAKPSGPGYRKSCRASLPSGDHDDSLENFHPAATSLSAVRALAVALRRAMPQACMRAGGVCLISALRKEEAMFQRFAMCLCCLWLCACAGRENASSVPPPADIVSTTLGQAAEQAHEDLAMVARLRGQGMQPLLPPPDPALQRPVSVAWTGPMEGALKEICLQVGYRYQEVGRPSAQTMTVVVRGQNRPAYELLEDIAWQAQPLAFVRVDPINRTITLARTSGREKRS